MTSITAEGFDPYAHHPERNGEDLYELLKHSSVTLEQVALKLKEMNLNPDQEEILRKKAENIVEYLHTATKTADIALGVGAAGVALEVSSATPFTFPLSTVGGGVLAFAGLLYATSAMLDFRAEMLRKELKKTHG